MRPVQLEMEGFGAFRDPTTVDFEGADLFALLGPTGAGKSTVIDAICFALYGNVPRYEDQRLVGAAMSSHAVETRVRLRFEVSGQAYDVVRVVRRGNGGKISTREARLEEVDGAVLAGREGELKGAVEDLLGLTFDDFTRCVVLPQGAFARFLHDKPADRQALLVRLLDLGIYGRMLQRANSRAAELDRQAAFIDGRLASLPETSPDRIEALTEELAVIDAAIGDADGLLPTLRDAEAASEEARQAVARASSDLDALRSVEVPDDVARLASRSREARDAATDAETAHRAAVERLDGLIAAEAELPGADDRRSRLELWDRHDKGVGVVAELDDQTAAAEATATAAAAELALSESTVEEATATVARTRTEHLAHALAADLRPGLDCPVCLRPVDRVPELEAPPALAVVQRGLDDAESARRRARSALDAAAQAAATLAGRRQRAHELLAEMAADLAAGPDRATLVADLAAATERERAIVAARAAEQAARQQVSAARRAADAADDEEQRFAGRMHAQRDRVVGLGAPAPDGPLAEAWTALAAWAAGRSAELTVAHDDAVALCAQLRERELGCRDQLAGIAGRCGLEVPATAGPDVVMRALDRERHARERRLTEARQALDQRAGLLDEREQVGIGRAVAVELGRLLKADRFQRWLVEETLVDLAARASERLAAMSGDRFSLDLQQNGEFSVIDHHEGDERRPVRTLSGGETFQASLALALALSDHLVEMSGRRGHALESIFLDEGFGTLDAESLEAVASTIESLHHDGRMVGIVTHVPALGERMPVRFVVSRGARSAQVERVTV